VRLEGLRFLDTRCPAWLRPRLAAGEKGDGQRLRFHVDIFVPAIGRVVHDRGHLRPPHGTPA